MTLPILRIEGDKFHTLEGFYDEIERQLLAGEPWGRNLDAFNDILRGDFGPIPSEFQLDWIDSALSRERLGYSETIRQLQIHLERCHSSGRESVRAKLVAAESGIGPTVFDWLVDIIRDHENLALRLA